MKVVGVLILMLAVVFPSGNASSEILSPLSMSGNDSRVSWEGLAIVVNRQNPTSNLSLAQLRTLFLGERKWWSKRHRVVLSAMQRGTPERASVLRIVYKMDERDLNNYFLYQVFKGEGPFAPVILRTPADVRKFVGTTPGAVGYLRASDVDDSVKVVRVNGLLPDDDGYPMRLRARLPK
jgi:ABC-type phosphate transport system substrate-binding protein